MHGVHNYFEWRHTHCDCMESMENSAIFKTMKRYLITGADYKKIVILDIYTATLIKCSQLQASQVEKCTSLLTTATVC